MFSPPAPRRQIFLQIKVCRVAKAHQPVSQRRSFFSRRGTTPSKHRLRRPCLFSFRRRRVSPYITFWLFMAAKIAARGNRRFSGDAILRETPLKWPICSHLQRNFDLWLQIRVRAVAGIFQKTPYGDFCSQKSAKLPQRRNTSPERSLLLSAAKFS